jgi:hypothetical protein
MFKNSRIDLRYLAIYPRGRAMLNKKGFMITPIIFIALFLIAMVFSFYLSGIDADTSKGMQTAAAVEKGALDIYKKQINQMNFAKLSAYECSSSNCYSSANESIIESCVNTKLNNYFNDTNWNTDISNDSGIYRISVNLSSFNVTNINMESDRVYEEAILHTVFFKIC